MAETIIMPKLGMAMKEGKVAKWRFREGDAIRKGDVVAEIETEKINYQLEASTPGILARIVVGEGQSAPVGGTIGYLVREGETLDESALAASGPAPVEAAEPAVSGAAPQPAASEAAEGRVKVTPVAKKMAKDLGVDLAAVTGTGPGGRITKEDILAAAEAAKAPKKPEARPAPSAGKVSFGSVIPLTRMREIIGQRLTASSRDVPHVYFAAEVDCTGMIRFRKTFLDIIESARGVRLSFNDIIIQASAFTIAKYPLFNATLDGKTVKVNEDVNIGLAVAREEGLIVPVIRAVQTMTLGEVAVARKAIIDRAQAGKLTLDDLTGGTFTVSNLGQFDIEFFTSIINPPEAGILSVAKMKDRAVVVNGEIVVRPTMYLGLSADHRVVDGAMAAGFLQDIKKVLENPFLMCVV